MISRRTLRRPISVDSGSLSNIWQPNIDRADHQGRSASSAHGFAKWILGALAWTNLAVLVFVAVAGDIADTSWVTMLVSNLPVFPFLLPSLVIAALAWSLRQVILAMMHVAAFVVGILVLIPFGFPRPNIPGITPADNTKKVRVMSYNVNHGEQDPATIVANIKDLQPDVFCLQEADQTDSRNTLQTRLREDLKDYDLRFSGGMVVGSRSPISKFTTHTLEYGTESRPIQDVTVDWNGTPVRVLNVQFNTCLAQKRLVEKPSDLPIYMMQMAGEQGAQANQIIKLVPGDPPIVCGDFGGPPQGPNYRAFRKVMHDAFFESGEGLGLSTPANFPMQRPDNILIAYGWKADKCWLPHVGGSDHLPIVAEVHSTL